MNSISISYVRELRVLLAAAMALSSFGVAGSAEALWGTEGLLSVRAEGEVAVERLEAFAARADLSDTDSLTGAQGNQSGGAYTASVPLASADAWTSAQNGYYPPNDDYWWANATMEAIFRDQLTFTIAPGSYPSGVQAILHVHAEGSVDASSTGFARHQVNYVMEESVSILRDAPAGPLNTDFTLTADLLPAGSSPSSPVIRTRSLYGSAYSSSSTLELVSEWASSDMSSEIVCIELTPGVTWTAESGVLVMPACPVLLPSHSQWGLTLLLAALLGSGIWMASRRANAMA